MNKIKLFLIDNQIDFCDPKGNLYVPGAENDVKRTTDLIKRIGHKLDDIICTLDSHHVVHIANPVFWKNSKGEHPSPFTQITAKDVESGVWTTTIPSLYKHGLSYVQQLEKRGRYTLTIWNPHCLIGSVNHAIVPELFGAIKAWEEEFVAIAQMVTKGSNYKTEAYSVLKSEIPDPSDPNSQLNTGLIETLETCDTLIVAGQALSHCLANSIYDLADNFGDASFIKKIVLLTDCTSNVPGFESLGDKFIKDMTYRGMQVTTSDKFLV